MSKFINGLFIEPQLPSETFGGCINIYENAFPNADLAISMIEEQCRDYESPVKFAKAETIGQGIYQDLRTNSFFDITYGANLGDVVCQNINNQFHLSLLATTSSYLEQYQINEYMFHGNYHLLKYTAGSQYKKHYDGGTETGRCLSALAYLNDNYEGGEIEFPVFGIKIKPKAGSIILFPSNFPYAHIAHPVIEGVKYALVTWILDRRI